MSLERMGMREYALGAVDTREALRYAGCRGEPPAELQALLADCVREALPALACRVCFDTFSVAVQGAEVDLGFARVRSSNLAKNLTGCGSAVLFAATVGLGLDRLIARYSRTAPSRALLLQAIGAERIERLCDAFNEEVRAEARLAGQEARPRFSPGYGDLPLGLQREIFRALEPERRIGLTLNGSLLMSPTKSVTALIGIGPARGTDGTQPGHDPAGQHDGGTP